MAYGSTGVIPRIFFLLFIIVALAIGGSLWFDYLGVINVKDAYAPAFRFFGLGGRTKVESPDAPDLLDTERFSKLMAVVDLRAEELQIKEVSLDSREKEILQQAAAMDEQRKALEDQEKSLSERLRQYDNRVENLKQNAKYLNGMPPAKAVAMLLAMKDQDMIDHLRTVEQLAWEAGEDSSVAYWLSLMPAERAATIQRLMVVKPKV